MIRTRNISMIISKMQWHINLDYFNVISKLHVVTVEKNVTDFWKSSSILVRDRIGTKVFMFACKIIDSLCSDIVPKPTGSQSFEKNVVYKSNYRESNLLIFLTMVNSGEMHHENFSNSYPNPAKLISMVSESLSNNKMTYKCFFRRISY